MKAVRHILLIFLTLMIFSCEDNNSYILEGKIKKLQSHELYIISEGSLRIDTIKAKFGLFSKTGRFTYKNTSQTAEPLLIKMENDKVWVTVWVENGEKIILKGDANYPELILAKGGKINKLLTKFKTENFSLIKEKCELRDKMIARTENHEELNASNDSHLLFQIKNVDQILKTQAQNFVEHNPSSIAALVLIQDYILDIENASNIQPFLDILPEEVKANYLYEKLKMLSFKDLQTKVNQPALDFSIRNIKNDTISLDTFKDKYLILTFATSQCEFCVPDFTELINIKNTFSEKDLAILTVSLDESKENWKDFANQHEITWTQVIDSVGWDSEIASLYNVLSLPCHYLIDNKGIIIGSKLQVDSIQTILTEKLSKNE